MKDVNTNQEKWSQSLIAKLAFLAIIGLLFLIPLQMIKSVIMERQTNAEKVKQEISMQWALQQTISGPVLNIPVKNIPVKKDEEAITRVWHILPENLVINGNVEPEIRNRGIYQSVVYNSDLQLSGKFIIPGTNSMKDYEVLWDKAYFSTGISDNRGLKGEISLITDSSKLIAEPGVYDHDLFESGITFSSPVTYRSGEINFTMTFKLSGSGGLFLTPLGKTTTAHIGSGWASPSFSGSFLPSNRTINENGFKADWEVTNLNRNFPQEWIGGSYRPSENSFGFELLIPVDHYQKSWRSVRYGILFITLTFLALIFLETTKKEKIHIFHYVLVSFGLVLFFSLLTSLSEHIGFNLSYLISSFATIILITLFIRSLLRNKKALFIIAGILVILYSFIFVLLSMNDYAYLAGNIGLFILLAVIMRQAGKMSLFKKGNDGEASGNDQPVQ